jgi:hypothetical protein
MDWAGTPHAYAIVHERLSLTSNGKVLLKLKTRWRDGSTHSGVPSDGCVRWARVLDPLTHLVRGWRQRALAQRAQRRFDLRLHREQPGDIFVQLALHRRDLLGKGGTSVFSAASACCRYSTPAS